MRLDHLQKIVNRVLGDMACPRCQTPLKKGVIHVTGVSQNRIELQSECPVCHAQTNIVGQLQNEPVGMGNGLASHPAKKTLLSPETVKQISERLKNFSGKDVRELFSS